MLLLDGKVLDVILKPHELKLTPNSLILAVGILSSKVSPATGIRNPKSFKFFRRFYETRSDGWYIGRDRWDAISFQPRLDIRVFGCGIFEPYPEGNHSFKYGYKYQILAASTQDEVYASPIFEEDILMPLEPNNPESGVIGEPENHIIKYLFKSHPQGIRVGAG